jgi:hypothetical protein
METTIMKHPSLEEIKELLTKDPDQVLNHFTAITKQLTDTDTSAKQLAEERAALAARIKSFEAVGDPAKAIEALQRVQEYSELGDPTQLKRIRDEHAKLSDTFKQQAELFGKTLEEKNAKVKQTEEKAVTMSAELAELAEQNKKLTKQYEKLSEAFSTEQKRAREASINAGLSKALSTIDLIPGLRRAAEALWKPTIEVADDGSLVVTRDNKKIRFEDAISEWAATDEGKAFLRAPQSSGEISAPGVEAPTAKTPEAAYKNADGTINWTKLTKGLSAGDEVASRLLNSAT